MQDKSKTFFQFTYSCLIKNYLRRRLAGNLTGKSSDAHSVMDSSPLLRCRLDLPATLPHDASTGREQTTLNAVSLVARRIAHARFARAKHGTAVKKPEKKIDFCKIGAIL